MSERDENTEQRIGLWLAGIAAGLAAAATLFFSVWGWETGKIEGAGAAEELPQMIEGASAVDAAPVVLSDDAAAVVVENGVVKFYFASGKSDLAEGAEAALQDVLSGVKEGKKAVVSGFHDTTGNQAKNEELSKQRAFAVKNALMGLGVEESRIELRKPENSAGSGSNAEARRVEVVLE